MKHALIGFALIIRSNMIEYADLSESRPPDPLLWNPLALLQAASTLLKPMADKSTNKRLNDACRFLTLAVRNALMQDTSLENQ